MNIRLSTVKDNEKILEMYRGISKVLNDQGIFIYDDHFPGTFILQDIESSNSYVVEIDDKIVASFSFYDSSIGASSIEWIDNDAKAFYIARVIVDVNYSSQGIGTYLIDRAKQMARDQNGQYLRLFVVDTNIPAVKFYEKNNFIQAKGLYVDRPRQNIVLHEYGYEIKTS